jgi:hypothetical protein
VLASEVHQRGGEDQTFLHLSISGIETSMGVGRTCEAL